MFTGAKIARLLIFYAILQPFLPSSSSLSSSAHPAASRRLLLASFLPLSPGTSGRGPHCQTLSTLLRIISLPPSLVRVFLLCLWQQHFLIFCNICRVFFSTFFSCVACCVSTSSSEQRQQQVSHEVDQKRQANVANSCAVVGISLVPLSFPFFGQTSLLSYVKCAKCFSRLCSHAQRCSTLS